MNICTGSIKTIYFGNIRIQLPVYFKKRILAALLDSGSAFHFARNDNEEDYCGYTKHGMTMRRIIVVALRTE